jgi:hypothetical protein
MNKAARGPASQHAQCAGEHPKHEYVALFGVEGKPEPCFRGVI